MAWRQIWTDFRKTSELFLRSILEEAGQEFRRAELSVTHIECGFCQEFYQKSVHALFNVCGIGKGDKSLKIPCCLSHKQDIESGHEWLINNLRVSRGMTIWEIVPRNLGH